MFPPGPGNDNLDAGDIYVISLFGTNQVLTVGEKLCLEEYEDGRRDQMWVCEMTSNHQIGMRNRYNNCFLGRRDDDQFACTAPHNLAWEWLTFIRLSLGGYSLWVTPAGDDSRRAIQHINGSSPHLKVGEVPTQFGLHKLRSSVFRRFEWVVPCRLARSSAPYFDGDDSDESINVTSIELLNNYEIKNIISLNSIELSPREKGRLRAAKISYSHIKAVECTAVTQEQFDQIWNAYDKAGTTLVYCGYGDGRTGMAISAIQLFEGRTLSDLDYRANGVQCLSQLAALNQLSERIHGVEGEEELVGTSDTQPPPYTSPEKKKP
ncbi:hypothetical protein HOY80DRAFT_1137078 [Tuber brumale]|nr:hypothetical protein HOY80DRAFT_1137078 [Tuber brumale]